MDELDDLYALKPLEFVAARDALVARLRKDGERERAAEVKALRRPSVAAWVLNRLAREEPHALEELESLGNELRSAQRAALSGAGADRLRDAARRRRVVVERLARRAEAILERGGMTSAQAGAVRSALEAAATDPDAALRLRAGRLEREPEGPSGFGDLGGLRLVLDDESEAQAEKEGAADVDVADAERAAERARRVEEAQAAAALARAQAEEADKEVEALASALEEARLAATEARLAARTAEEAAARVGSETD